MEQSHSMSDVLSGLRENPSALMSAQLSMEYSDWYALWMVMLERSGLKLTVSGGGGGGRISFNSDGSVQLRGKSEHRCNRVIGDTGLEFVPQRNEDYNWLWQRATYTFSLACHLLLFIKTQPGCCQKMLCRETYPHWLNKCISLS